MYNNVYAVLLFFIFFVIVFGLLILVIIVILNDRFSNNSILYSVYECGFLPFHEARIQFEFKFYVVALSFIIFDLEIGFLLPWFVVYMHLTMSSLIIVYIFFIFIIISLIYEFQCGLFDFNIK